MKLNKKSRLLNETFKIKNYLIKQIEVNSMKKKLALMVYPNFSMQEIASICGLFKWQFDSETVVFSSSLEEVNAEEGLLVKPHKTFDEFSVEDYDCLILPGCSDFSEAIRNPKIKNFLQQFNENDSFIIGAICAGPLFLAQAGLLSNKKFINSLFVEINEMFSFINEENLVYQPVVEDGNIITAVGSAFNEFAVAVARKLGYDCPDSIYTGITSEKLRDESFFKQHLPEEYLLEIRTEFADFISNN